MKSKKVVILAISIGIICSCRKGNDLYVNPNSPAQPKTPQTMLTGIEAGTFMNYEGGLARIASIMIQHNSGVSAQAISYDNYVMDPSDLDNYWNTIYSGTLINAKLMYTTYETAN